MSSSFGNMIKITTFGQSHSDSIGVVVDGLPSGIEFDINKVESFMQRRAPGKNRFSTTRQEADKPKILSGLVDNTTCGAPVCAVIENNNTRSKDYDKLKNIPRPMHSDYPASVKYNGFNDIRGGGQFSGRLTAPLCFAGALTKQILQNQDIQVFARIYSIGFEKDIDIDNVNPDINALKNVAEKDFPVIDNISAEKMMNEIDNARNDGDSIGGVIQCVVTGLPVGLGEPIYDSVESKISALMFSVPAVKGIEFGEGFNSSKLRGSIHNDEFEYDGEKIKTSTNRHGGILGGITTGMPLIFKVAFKPTPSILKEQNSVDLCDKKNTKLKITGRHDPCIVQRAVPCVESVANIAICDLLLEERGRQKWISKI